MTNPSCLLQDANDAAARAGLAWLQAVGLATEIDVLRFRDDSGPIPAPGLTTLVADADRASAAAALAADRAAALARDHAASDAAVTAVGDALTAAHAAERAARVVAQLALGVSAHLIGDDRVERLERTAVAVPFPPAVDQPRVRLIDDGIRLQAKVRPELVVEIAGTLCRLLVERNASFRLTGPADKITEVTVDGGTTLGVTTNVNPAGFDGDWHAVSGGGWGAYWPSPVTVREPAEVITDLLLPHRTMSQGDVVVGASSYVVELAGCPGRVNRDERERR